jgi:hypothetical protein
MVGDSMVKTAIDRIAAGHEKRYEERYRFAGGMDVVTPALPQDAKVLIHNIRMSLGIGRAVVDDEHSWQLGIDYVRYATPEETLATWRSMGVTHAVWVPQQAGGTYELVAREAVFAHALELFSGKVKSLGGYKIAPLSRPPGKDARTPTRVAWLGCGGDPPTGVYLPANIDKRRPERLLSMAELTSNPKAQLAEVPVAVLRSNCSGMKEAFAEVRASFKQTLTMGDVAVWVRKQSPSE